MPLFSNSEVVWLDMHLILRAFYAMVPTTRRSYHIVTMIYVNNTRTILMYKTEKYTTTTGTIWRIKTKMGDKHIIGGKVM